MSSRLTVVLVSQQLATPALIFFLWLLILPATMAIQCPEGCWCDSGKYRVTCPMSSFNNITSVHPQNILEFHLVGNSVTSLKKDSFISKGLTELQELSLNRCGLETIEVRAFNGLTELTYLSLRRNRLSAIIPGTFENVSNLQYLGLEGNIIDRLEVDVFSGLSNLKYVHLTNNKLTSVHPNVFLGLPTLQFVYLSKNPGLQIPTDRHFINSRSLRLLDISKCNTSSVSVETFANVTALESLDLRYNNLRSVHINILTALPKLSALYVGGNPLQCDCQLQEVWRWCQDHNIQTVHEGTGPHCVIPSQGNSLPWMVLEECQCLQDNIRNNVAYQHKRYKRAEDENDQGYGIYNNFIEHFQLPVTAVLFMFGTTGNVIVLIIIICNKDMRTVPNMYIINLAISDMILLTFFFSISCADTISNKLPHTEFMNVFLPICCHLAVDLSAYSVAVLSYQRYRVTVDPFHVRVSSQSTGRTTLATICGVWIVASLFALPKPVLIFLIRKNEAFESLKYVPYIVLFDLLVSCVFPLCVIAFSYIMTHRHLVGSSCSIFEGKQHPQMNTRKITAKVVLGLTVAFLISYMPLYAFDTYTAFNTDWLVSSSYYTHFMYEIATCLVLINSCLNPVALFCTSSVFKDHLKRYLTCRSKANSPPTDIELTRKN